MDIIFFLFFMFVALLFSFSAYIIQGSIGVSLAMLGGAMMILTAIKIGTGEAITIVSNGSVVTLDIGLDRSHIFIIFILFAILIIISNSYIVLIRGTK